MVLLNNRCLVGRVYICCSYLQRFYFRESRPTWGTTPSTKPVKQKLKILVVSRLSKFRLRLELGMVDLRLDDKAKNINEGFGSVGSEYIFCNFFTVIMHACVLLLRTIYSVTSSADIVL